MSRKEITATLRTISGRSVPGGGFSEQPGAPFRVDATAWAILALKMPWAPIRILWNRQDQGLRPNSSSDGRVCLSQGPAPRHSGRQPWPFWHGMGRAFIGGIRNRGHSFSASHAKACDSRKMQNSGITTLDTSISGDGLGSKIHSPGLNRRPCLSWLLSLSGYGTHERVREAVRLLMDRQLPSGGWNYRKHHRIRAGNIPPARKHGHGTLGTGRTGGKKEIERSLDYLKSQAAFVPHPAFPWLGSLRPRRMG